MRAGLLAFWLLGSCSSALAQDVSGSARASDGDTLTMTGIVIRLHGIDAPELAQTCTRGGAEWACGRAAADRLSSLVAGGSVRCEQHDMDSYGRIVATCRIGGTDLSRALVEAGLAIALPQFTDAYIGAEARARDLRLGIWAGDFMTPADWRAAHPSARPRLAAPVAAPAPRASARPAGVFYPNCKAAWAAGAAPLYRGQPGYCPEMDGDGDGIACEPYRKR